MKSRVKSYRFWISLSGSVIILLKALGSAFDFQIDEGIVNDLIMSVCGVLVVLGIVEKPPEKDLAKSALQKNEQEKDNIDN